MMHRECEKWMSDDIDNYRIHTNSIEQTLSPLVVQITNLVNVRERPIRSERTARALVRVGRAVNLAVEQFVNVAEMMAEENAALAPEVRAEMCEVCRLARLAGVAIEQQTQVRKEAQVRDGTVWIVGEKGALVRAARQLLSAITRVLLLADRVIVLQLLCAKEKVLHNIGLLERLTHFGEFMKEFSDFGGHMVELGRLSGDRQMDLMSERLSSQMAYLRSCLEKTTMMLLTASKTNLRHPDCLYTQQLRTGVASHMRWLLDQLERLVMASSPTSATAPNHEAVPGLPAPAWKSLRDIEEALGLIRLRLNNLNSSSPSQIGAACGQPELVLRQALDSLLEGSILDFTDSAFTPHVAREEILALKEHIRREALALLQAVASITGADRGPDAMARAPSPTPAPTAVAQVLKLSELCRCLHDRLFGTCGHLADEVLSLRDDHTLLLGLKLAASGGDQAQTKEFCIKFSEHAEGLEEVAKLLRHCAASEALSEVAANMSAYTGNLTPLVLHAANTLAAIPSSKIGKETLEVFHEAWLGLMTDLCNLRQDVVESRRRVGAALSHVAPGPGADLAALGGGGGGGGGGYNRPSYMSLPRPGDCATSESFKHGVSARTVQTPQMEPEDQARIAKVGLEMKLITSEMEAEAERWQEPNNDIVKRAKIMSNLAYSMYLFTRGEGPLRTTHDLFAQAEYFASEGAKLHRTVADFTGRIPGGPVRTDLSAQLDRLPVRCQALHSCLRQVTLGKAATFAKVDQVIQDVKDTMNLVTKLVTACFICNTKFNIDYRQRSVQSPVPFPYLMRQHSNEDAPSGDPMIVGNSGGGGGSLMRSRSLGKGNASTFRRLHSSSPASGLN